MSQITKRALEASLKHLLLQKPLHKITINDITEDCGINRMTFYYPFKDIYDLVEWSCEEDARKALAGNRTYDTWQQGFLQILQAVLENKPFIMNVYHSVSREQVEKVWRGKWEKHHKHRGGFRRVKGIDDMGEQHEVEIDERCEYDDLYCSECGKQSPDNFLNFCAYCGASMTDEAVEMVMERLEALNG